jgi:diaminopimelate decarboxylase
MHDFKFKNGELYCETVKVGTIAQKVGTPCYIYSHHTLVDHFTKIKRAFAQLDPLICYAMKANDNLAVLRTLHKEGAGFDIVSIGELKKALSIGANPQKIVFASVGKTEEEIVAAIRAVIFLFNVESKPELEHIDRVAQRMKKTVQAALRINPDIEVPTHTKITTGSLKNKFGIDLKTSKKILTSQHRYANVQINGIHIHIGSQITVGAPFVKAVKRVIHFINELKNEGVLIKYLNIGGGLGIIYKNEKPQTAAQYAQKIVPLLAKTGLKLIMEPGRFIAGNAGIFVTKKLYLKDNGVKKFMIVDGGMNDLIRPSLYNAYHEIVPVKKSSTRKIKVDVVGPICESGDVFAKDRMVANVKDGELLAIMSAGAYGYVMSSNYNVRGRGPEVIVTGYRYSVTKPRETFNDLIRGERVPNFI